MKVKLAIIALCFAPSLAMACPAHEKQAMSCAEGSVFDSETGACVPQATS